MSEAKAPLRLVVVGDSTSFTDDRGPQLPAHPNLYPNVVARILEEALEREVAVNVLARAGSDARDTYRMLTKDRHAQFEVLMGADAVIVGIGSIDHAPVGVPPVLEAIVPYLRPEAVRRRARRALHAVHPVVTKLTGARLHRTPRAEFARLYDGVLFQVRSLARGAAGVAMGPTSHHSRYYGGVAGGEGAHPGRAAREALQFEVAARHGFPAVACWPLVAPAAGRLNPDGIHWPHDVHAEVAAALARPLVAQLRDGAARPQPPSF
jgi:hypothetical protein